MTTAIERPTSPGPHHGPRVLIADDDELCRAAFRRALRDQAVHIDVCDNGDAAVSHVRDNAYDVVIADINMPGKSGVELLREVRASDLDLPVILVTGEPAVDSAIRAVEYGALRYLPKPVTRDTLRDVVDYAVRINKLAQLKRTALASLGRNPHAAGDLAGLEHRFEHALADLWMAFQPIVSWQGDRAVAYEALVRCDQQCFPHPGALLEAAERLDRVHELSRVIRRRVAEAIPRIGGTVTVFVNLHPADLDDPQLGSEADPLTHYAHRVVLEITERASLSGSGALAGKLALLRRCGYTIAIDDLGAGYAGLQSFVQLHPEVVKIDMSLVRNIDQDPERRSIVRTIIEMFASMDVRCVVEGVETKGEAQTLAALGADLMQGYAFGKPVREFVEVGLDVLRQLKA